LLVLDTCEHVIAAAAGMVEALLHASPADGAPALPTLTRRVRPSRRPGTRQCRGRCGASAPGFRSSCCPYQCTCHSG
jgi:hypothetical protein